jgi:hypothetical protein
LTTWLVKLLRHLSGCGVAAKHIDGWQPCAQILCWLPRASSDINSTLVSPHWHGQGTVVSMEMAKLGCSPRTLRLEPACLWMCVGAGTGQQATYFSSSPSGCCCTNQPPSLVRLSIPPLSTAAVHWQDSAAELLTQIASSWHGYRRRVLLCVILSTGIRVRETNELEHDMWHTVTPTLGLLDSISVPPRGYSTERRLTSDLLGVVRTTSFFFFSLERAQPPSWLLDFF